MTLVQVRRSRTVVAGWALVGGGAVALGVAVAGCGGDAGAAEAGPRALEVVAGFGEVGQSPGQFTYPRALDSDGSRLWVIDKAARVQRVDPKTGAAVAGWSMPDSVLGKPCGVTVFPKRAGAGVEQLVYVPDTHYFRVMVYRIPADGGGAELVSQFGSYGEGPGQFTYLTDVAVLPGADGGVERIYVPEYGGNDRISVFDKEHRFLFAFGRNGSGAGEDVEFARPQSVEVDAARRRLVVTDACNHRVGVFTLDGKLVRWIGSPERTGNGTDEFAYPYGLALLEDGSALVTEFGNHRVHHVDVETGETLGLYGRPGRGPGELTNPWAITVLDGTVWVLDSGNARVQGFRVPRGRRAGAEGAHPASRGTAALEDSRAVAPRGGHG